MSGLVRYLTVPEGDEDVPHRIRVNAAGQISVVDVITNICCLGPDNQPISTARQSALSYYNRSAKEYAEVKVYAFTSKARLGVRQNVTCNTNHALYRFASDPDE